jgi:hypothetical protein
MNGTRELLERVGDRFPFPEEAFGRLVRRRDRRQRNRRLAAGVVGIAVFLVAVWVVTSGALSDRGSTPGGQGPTTAPSVDAPIGIIGLPPEGATPSAPARGELVVGFLFGHSGGDPGRFGLQVYADGRVIWQRLSSQRDAGLIEQRLTPEGVGLVRSEVLSTGLFDRKTVHLVGTYGLYFGEIRVREGDGFLRLAWGNVGPDDAPEELATAEQVGALERLDARLEDLTSWLPSSAWEQPEPTAFVASRYSVCLETDRGDRLEAALVTLPRPAADQLRGLRWTHQVIQPDRPASRIDVWCSFVTTEDARAIAEIIDEADTASSVRRDVFGLRYAFEHRDADTADVTLSFEPALPDAP